MTAASAGATTREKKPRRRATAESMAAKQRDISVAEFFTKNRHLLGFDNPSKALMTTIKEAVDNALDACEEAGILPDLVVEVKEVAGKAKEDRYIVSVQDNGPGIVRSQIPKIFGKLLYGSKFHRLRQSRGQQGIGISAAGMYGLLTTGQPIKISSRTSPKKPAHYFELTIDTKKNKPEILRDDEFEWEGVEHGTSVQIELQGLYKGGRRSLDEYLSQTAIANPHAQIHYFPPKGKPPQLFERATNELPEEPKEIKPHPHGVELGALIDILKFTKARRISSALQSEFSRVSIGTANKICEAAKIKPTTNPRRLDLNEIERLHKTIPTIRIMAPPASTVVPIGEELVFAGLAKEIDADFVTSCTRPPAVYRGNPFVIEVGLAYGGALSNGADDDEHVPGKKKRNGSGDQTTRLLRLANRVPLLYQQSACSIFKASVDTRWQNYGLSQSRGALPQAPMVLMVHMASVWVPFTSESKEAIAHYPQIIKEIKLGISECGRRLASYLRKMANQKKEARRRSIFELYCGELVTSLHKLTGRDPQRLEQSLLVMARKHTGFEEDDAVTEDNAAIADAVLPGSRRSK